MPQVPGEGRGQTLREAADRGPNDLLLSIYRWSSSSRCFQNMQRQSLQITGFMATAWPAHSKEEEEQEHLDLEALAELVLDMYPKCIFLT